MKLNVDPWPTWLWTPIRPPCSSTNFLAKRQPESRALLLPSVLAPDLAELLEDGRLILGRDPDPGVADGNGDDAVGRRRGCAPRRGRPEGHRAGSVEREHELRGDAVRRVLVARRINFASSAAWPSIRCRRAIW